MSSAGTPTTRERIRLAALALIQQGGASPSMGQIARAAGLSRQALYLSFVDKTDLFVDLVRWFDERRGIPAEIALIEAAADGLAAMTAMVDLQARLNPGLWPLAEAFDVLRRQDPAAERAWQDRLDNRHLGCAAIITRLAAEGRLRAGLSPAVATDLLWHLTSLNTWADLVVRRGWSAADYREHLGVLLRAGLLAS